MMFYMDTTKAPFNDNDVRLAIKLIADRQALIDGALNGYGSSATTSSARACRGTTSRCRSASRTSSRPSRCSRRPARRT